MTEAKVAESIQHQCKNGLEQIQLIRVFIKEFTSKCDVLESMLMELEHYAEEQFYGDLEGKWEHG